MTMKNFISFSSCNIVSIKLLYGGKKIQKQRKIKIISDMFYLPILTDVVLTFYNIRKFASVGSLNIFTLFLLIFNYRSLTGINYGSVQKISLGTAGAFNFSHDYSSYSLLEILLLWVGSIRSLTLLRRFLEVQTIQFPMFSSNNSKILIRSVTFFFIQLINAWRSNCLKCTSSLVLLLRVIR